MPRRYAEPHPGLDADWLILGPGWVLAPAAVAAGSAAVAALALTARRRQAIPRRSGVAAAAAGAGLPVPVVVGARFALEPGRGRSAVPVRPALLGAVAGVLGVLAAFTFAAGVSDAAANPARFGQTWQLDTFFGFSGQDFGPASQVLRAVAADPDVTGVDDARIGGAQSGQVSVESFTYDPGGRQAGAGRAHRRAHARQRRTRSCWPRRPPATCTRSSARRSGSPAARRRRP